MRGFSNRLKMLLDRANRSQRDLARMCGVSEKTASFWVRGLSFPSEKMIKKIMKCLAASGDDLFGTKQIPIGKANEADICQYEFVSALIHHRNGQIECRVAIRENFGDEWTWGDVTKLLELVKGEAATVVAENAFDGVMLRYSGDKLWFYGVTIGYA
jgi:transcriptional regulator with XRE-family HTH domain